MMTASNIERIVHVRDCVLITPPLCSECIQNLIVHMAIHMAVQEPVQMIVQIEEHPVATSQGISFVNLAFRY